MGLSSQTLSSAFVPLVARSLNITPPLEGVTNEDVLCGRQSLALRHVGNRSYLKVIHSYALQYQSSKHKSEKARITSKVIRDIHRRGGRFMKQTDLGWVKLDRRNVYDKVQHALRSAKIGSASVLKSRTPGTARSVIVQPSTAEEDLFRDILEKQQVLYNKLLLANDPAVISKPQEVDPLLFEKGVGPAYQTQTPFQL